MKGHIRRRSASTWAIILDVRDPETGKRRKMALLRQMLRMEAQNRGRAQMKGWTLGPPTCETAATETTSVTDGIG
jgi:hypothetical protein